MVYTVMTQTLKIVGVLAALAASAQAAPVVSHIQARKLLGSSFGIPGNNATFEYVIVGGGTAGLTLATRLAEQQKGRVAVIEAGGFYEIGNSNISQVPAGDGTYAGKAKDDWQPLVDWGYVTTPQAVSSELDSWGLMKLIKTLGSIRCRDSLRTRKMSWRKLSEELYGLPARHQSFIPEVGRHRQGSKLYI